MWQVLIATQIQLVPPFFFFSLFNKILGYSEAPDVKGTVTVSYCGKKEEGTGKCSQTVLIIK